MEATEAAEAGAAKKRRTEEEDKKPSMLASMFDFDDSDDDDDDVPMTEETERQISDYMDRLQTSGPADPVACRTDEYLIEVVNTAIRHHKKKNKMMDLVLLEILSATMELCGKWQFYITFKGRDSSGAVRTYETLINPGFSDEEVVLEIFRVKPYTGVEYSERKVERPSCLSVAT